MIDFRTDLAAERREIYLKNQNIESNIPGVESEEKSDGDNIFIKKIKIIDNKGEEALGKKARKLCNN